MSETVISWRRMAEPQADGYDTDNTLRLAQCAGYARPSVIDEPTFLDGAVSLKSDPDLWFPDECLTADPSHKNVARAEELLRLWPVVREQSKRLLDNITLFQFGDNDQDHVIGSVCGPGTRGFGSVGVTVDHHVGFVEGIVHEMAHHKLRALGVDVECADKLLLNDPALQYPSPIRYDCLRPMTAVLHAQYSYTYILQLDLHILAADLDQDRDRSIVEHSLAVITPKIEFGTEVLQRDAITDSNGSEFLEGLYAWTDRIIADCDLAMANCQVSRIPFCHPLISS